jgi:ABC-type transporter Mla MlaB component
MALSILKKNNIYYLKGKLNTSTSRSFIIQFEHIISNNNCLEINVDGINEIDINGANAIDTIKAIALNMHKVLSVSSNHKNEIYNSISFSNAA